MVAPSRLFRVANPKVNWAVWFGAAFVSALFAWGRHGAFYQLLYALPYFSTIRNPMKFMHPCHMALMILFAYGLQGLAREYFEKARATVTPDAWEKRWKFAMFAVVALSALGWIVYSAEKADLVKFMTAHFVPAELAPETVKFSVKEAGIFVLLLAICVGAVLAIQAGIFRGSRAVWAGILLGLILFGDFARANAPWIQYFDYKGRYASNPVIDTLKEKSWEQRVILFNANLIISDPALRSFFEQSRERQQLFGYFAQVFSSVYHSEWVQHQFQYYNVQMMDVAQEPRMATEKKMYLEKVGGFLTRYWQLTNTRYIFAPGGGFVEVLNDRFDPQLRRFRVNTAFNLFQKNGTTHIGVETNANGAVALIEFTGALPRAKLYTQWRSMTNDMAALSTLGDPAFNPATEVLVDEEIPAPAAGVAPAEGQVEFTHYETKHFTQKTSSTAPGVLLMNDRHHPDWKITIDGQPAKLLRANFIMRGVQVPAGQHTIDWRFEPKKGALYVTISALAFGAILCGLLALLTRVPATAARRK